jgi:hypothetical protein
MHVPVIPHGLLIMVHNQLFNSLIDTGADYSFMDIEIAKSLHILAVPADGIIVLASESHSLPRFGTTPLLSITPVIVQDTLRMLSPRTHAFELMNLPRHKHQFIIGLDLLHPLFGKNIPTSLLPQPPVDLSTSVASTQVSKPASSLIHTPIPRSALTSAVAQELRNTIDALAGQGYNPSDEERPGEDINPR